MKQLTGILLIAISAASFGTLAIFGRFLYADGLDTFTMLQVVEKVFCDRDMQHLCNE